MFKRIVASCVFLSAAVLNAQNQSGTWQGTLNFPNNGPHLRLLVKVSEQNGVLVGKMYSIDQSSSPIPLSSIRFVNGELDFNLAALGASYRGAIAADGITSSGTYIQGEVSLPLTLKHVSDADAWPTIQNAQPLERMKLGIDPGVEVATIKPTSPKETRTFLTIQSDRVLVVNMTVADVLSFAYGLQRDQILGLPEWARMTRYNITVKADVAGQPDAEQMKTLLRKVLADRLALNAKPQKRVLNVYLLQTDTLRMKAGANDAIPALFFKGPGDLMISNSTMNDLCQILQSNVLNRPVLDRTERPGRWNGELLWTPDTLQGGPTDQRTSNVNDRYPSVFTATREQLGLKLTAAKAEAPVLEVVGIHQPSAN